MDAEDLYDEFGNYIGPEIEDDDGSETESEEDEPQIDALAEAEMNANLNQMLLNDEIDIDTELNKQLPSINDL